MTEPRFLIVRLGSLGDIIHTLPASAVLRDSFPGARIDWLVEGRWRQVLEGNQDLNNIITLDRSGVAPVVHTVNILRSAHYTCALDFHSLYKSVLFARAAGAREVVGFEWTYAREPLVSLFYTRRVEPVGAHKVEHNLTLAEAVGASRTTLRFTLPVSPEAERWAEDRLEEKGLKDFYVISPGGGWRSKCWPAGRYGKLHRELAKQFGWRGIVSFGPGEEALADELVTEAGDPSPVVFSMDLAQLLSVLRHAKLFVGADTGPLHLAAALGTPVVGLFGPTDPARNGPYTKRAVVVRNALEEEMSYLRGKEYSPAMLRIRVEDVVDAIRQLLEID